MQGKHDDSRICFAPLLQYCSSDTNSKHNNNKTVSELINSRTEQIKSVSSVPLSRTKNNKGSCQPLNPPLLRCLVLPQNTCHCHRAGLLVCCRTPCGRLQLVLGESPRKCSAEEDEEFSQLKLLTRRSRVLAAPGPAVWPGSSCSCPPATTPCHPAPRVPRRNIPLSADAKAPPTAR